MRQITLKNNTKKVLSSLFSFAVHYWDRTLIANTDQTVYMDKEHVLYKVFEMGCPVTEKHILREMADGRHPYLDREALIKKMDRKH